MDVEVFYDGFKYNLRFEKGENVSGLLKEPTKRKQTGSKFKWKPDLDVFTDIAIPTEWFEDVLKRQAVVNSGVVFEFRNYTEEASLPRSFPIKTESLTI